MSEQANNPPLPVYQCHKRVWAFQIKTIVVDNFNDKVHLRSVAGHTAVVPTDVCMKHNPKPGWYYVQYEDGYISFSPSAAFEAGYSLVE